ncbi:MULTISPECIES: A24 family peptidase [unclassified Pantoea]|uniref:prepilin peptidase n=1 Tax=unclassified Pantoea TaxID=2630326 RepID=UPI00247752DF|nr:MULTISPECIES: A24 family peptidase [unclassified Pantoea]GME45291.1 A24 family peptidase [Pantoea sp. QMID3]GME48270.1 A24 family peptidase [Pantoea sp. QMID1]GME60714.1 A24 family peptidase [Pantoea sp. QMID4]GME61679.1 A24 family peptidase [Pantoea sp. QMID2]
MSLTTQFAALAGGGVLGSFLSLACVRFSPALSPAQWFIALCFPGSRCDCCQQRLLWRDTLPLISWPRLRGRCRFCHHLFSAESFITEWLVAILCLLVLQSFTDPADAIFVITASSLLLMVAAIDRHHFCIPDPLSYLLLWLGLLHATMTGNETAAIWGALSGYCTLWLLAWSYRQVRGYEGLGYGDMKLFAALGACCGWQALPWIALVSTFLALTAIVMLKLRGSIQENSPLPFGPFLAIAGWVTIVLQTRFTLL